MNRWKCRVPNNPQAAGAIQTALIDLHDYLSCLQNYSIETIQFDDKIYERNSGMTIGKTVELCFNQIKKRGQRFGPTTTAKLLHILQPELFVMWDSAILKYYHKKYKQVNHDGAGYLFFLKVMSNVANNITQEFINVRTSLNPPAQLHRTPSAYLSECMGYNPHKTMAKYLDEYNWVTISFRLKVPPDWHP